MPLNPDVDPCPCQSGQVLRDCGCLRPGGRLVPPMCDTRPPGPPTGFGHPRCYARELMDCCETLSLEHAVPRSILEEMASRGGLGVMGLSWLGDRTLERPGVSGLGGNVLCRRHNSALSEIDRVGVRFFRSMDWQTKGDGCPGEGSELYLFNGHDIERFILKAVACFVASGQMPGFTRGTSVAEGWLQILFQNHRFPPGAGLYRPAITSQSPGPAGTFLAPLFDRTGRLFAVRFGVCDIEFSLAFESPPAGHPGFVDRHPSGAELRHGERRKKVAFHWEEPASKMVLAEV